jgi:hypothetical protein
VIYNGLSRRDETRLFIDINTKQKPVPSQLLLDIKQLADIETEAEEVLRDVFDAFDEETDSAMIGLLSPAEASRTKITRVTFNHAVKPLLPLFTAKDHIEIYNILNAYLLAVTVEIANKTPAPILAKPVIFRAFLSLFRPIVQRSVDKFGQEYTSENFQTVLGPVFSNLPITKLEKPGSSWAVLRDYLEKRVVAKLTL